ncbi:MAG: hypothetical protein U1E05_04420 [Patescibacteria group bacterium]|nr:hypothetical protein [Patescibacteria group bacterium]
MMRNLERWYLKVFIVLIERTNVKASIPPIPAKAMPWRNPGRERAGWNRVELTPPQQEWPWDFHAGHRAAFYSDYRLGDKWQRRGF